MHLLICVGTRFLNLLEKLGVVGDHVPKDDRGDAEEAGECIVKACRAGGSLLGEASMFTSHLIVQPCMKINDSHLLSGCPSIGKKCVWEQQKTRQYPKCQARER